jgi:thioredoxin reductase (NADPH)
MMEANGRPEYVPLQEIDVAVIGGGPIGIEMAIALGRAGIDYILFESSQIGAAISRWPRHTHFYSTPEHVALAGVPVHNVDQLPLTGEQYLAYLRMLVETFGVRLHNYEPVERLTRDGDGFVLRTRPLRGKGIYRARRVILTTGGMAGPRLLGIPGEDLPHVSHYFGDPHTYFHTQLLVVGGRNSALESALRSWRAGAEVTISYRRPAFDYDRAKPHLAQDMQTRLENGEIQFLPGTAPVRITPDYVELGYTDAAGQPTAETFRHATDFVLLNTGFVADMELFRQAGVTLHGEQQIPEYDEETMETDSPGVYVAGTAAGGTQIKFEFFISTCHDHVAKIVRHLIGAEAGPLGTVDSRRSAVTLDEVKAN